MLKWKNAFKSQHVPSRIFWVCRGLVDWKTHILDLTCEGEREREGQSERERGRGGERGNRLRSDLCHVVVFTDIFETKTYSSYINEGLTEVWCWPPHE